MIIPVFWWGGLSSCRSDSKERSIFVSKATQPKNAVELVLTNDCLHCHSIEDRIVGPPYLDIARKYRGDLSIKATLVDKIKNGGGGLWYGGVMSGHPLMKDAELNLIVDWILATDQYRKRLMHQAPNYTLHELPKTQEPNQFRLKTYLANTRLNHFEQLDTTSCQGLTGTAEYINFLGSKAFDGLPKNSILKFEGTIEATYPGKYFFKLQKTGTGQLFLDEQSIISTQRNDQEIMIEMKEGPHRLEVFYQYEDKNDSLSLQWLAPQMEYYELTPGKSS